MSASAQTNLRGHRVPPRTQLKGSPNAIPGNDVRMKFDLNPNASAAPLAFVSGC